LVRPQWRGLYGVGADGKLVVDRVAAAFVCEQTIAVCVQVSAGAAAGSVGGKLFGGRGLLHVDTFAHNKSGIAYQGTNHLWPR
jgi:hypothetical protein